MRFEVSDKEPGFLSGREWPVVPRSIERRVQVEAVADVEGDQEGRRPVKRSRIPERLPITLEERRRRRPLPDELEQRAGELARAPRGGEGPAPSCVGC